MTISAIAQALNAEQLVPVWLPQGKQDGEEWVALNPRRADKHLGSFRINLKTGLWADFATGDKGGDLVSLYAYLHGTNNHQAAKELAAGQGLTALIQNNQPLPDKPKASAKTAWQPIVPAPEYALKTRPVTYKHFVQGSVDKEYTPTAVYEYQDIQGNPLFWVYRIEKEHGKETIPVCFCENEQGVKQWRYRAPLPPHSLYGLQNLRTPKDLIVLVEGEKCADIGDLLPENIAVISWLGGCKKWKKTDFSPLYGKKILLWADNDAVGKIAMNGIAQMLQENNCTVAFVEIPPNKPQGWDIADCHSEKGIETVRDYLLNAAHHTNEPYVFSDEECNQQAAKESTPENKDDYALEPTEPKKPKGSRSKEEIRTIWQRFVYIDGTSDIFDLKYNKFINRTAADMAMGGMFKSWNKSPYRRVLPPDAIVFDLTGEKCPENGYINLFDGLEPELEQIKPFRLPENLPFERLLEMPKKCNKIIGLICHLCNQDIEQVEWLLNWLALPLQKRGTKMATAVVVKSHIQGAGKSLFFDGVMRKIYGKYARHFVQSDLESQFNANREFCLFGVFEEIFTGKSKYDYTGSLKDLITTETMRIEKKHFDAVESQNFMNCVFLSNYIQPFPIEENDRRYMVIAPDKALDKQAAAEIVAEIENGGVLAFYRFLLSLPLTLTQGERRGKAANFPFHANTFPLMTEAKKVVIKWGFASWQAFFYDWQQGEIGKDIPFSSCTSKDLWRLYLYWCDRSNEMKMKKNQFLLAVQTKLPLKRIRLSTITGGVYQANCFLIGEKTEQSEYFAEINRFADKIREL